MLCCVVRCCAFLCCAVQCCAMMCAVLLHFVLCCVWCGVVQAQKEKEKEKKEEGEGKVKQDEEEESSEEELEAEADVPFDEAEFLNEAKHRLNNVPVRIIREQPAQLDEKLVGKFIAFHNVDGWDAGQIIKHYTAAVARKRFPKSMFNYDVQYAALGGSVNHHLDLDLYGTGGVLSSWVLMEPVTKKRKHS